MKKCFYLILLFPLLLSSCGKDDKKALSGAWELKIISLTVSPSNFKIEKELNESIKENFERAEIRFHEDNTYSLTTPADMQGIALTGTYSYEKETLILKNPNFPDGSLSLSAIIINKGKSLKIKVDNAPDFDFLDDEEANIEKDLLKIKKVTIEFIFDKK